MGGAALVVRALRKVSGNVCEMKVPDPAGPFQKPLSNGDAVSHEDLALDVRRLAFGVFFRS